MPPADRLNGPLGRLLGVGTWTSCGLLAFGMIRPSPTFVTAGIVLLIALPMLSVATMGVLFLFSRERDLALVAALVLAIVGVSIFFGVVGA